MEELITWINQQLQLRGWSQAELARRAGISPGALSLVINRERRAGTEMCTGLASAFGVPPVQVFRLAGLLPSQPDQDAAMIEQFLDYWANMNLEQRKNTLRVAWAFYLESQGVALNLDSIRGPVQDSSAPTSPAPPATAPDVADS